MTGSNAAQKRTWEDDLDRPVSAEAEPAVPVRTMVLAFKGKEISASTFTHVIDDGPTREVPANKVPVGLSAETKHYRRLLELDLLNPNDPDIHFLVARKVGDGPWATNQVDRPEDFRSDVERILTAEHPLPPQPSVSNFSLFGVDEKFLQKQWDKIHSEQN